MFLTCTVHVLLQLLQETETVSATTISIGVMEDKQVVGKLCKWHCWRDWTEGKPSYVQSTEQITHENYKRGLFLSTYTDKLTNAIGHFKRHYLQRLVLSVLLSPILAAVTQQLAHGLTISVETRHWARKCQKTYGINGHYKNIIIEYIILDRFPNKIHPCLNIRSHRTYFFFYQGWIIK